MMERSREGLSTNSIASLVWLSQEKKQTTFHRSGEDLTIRSTVKWAVILKFNCASVMQLIGTKNLWRRRCSLGRSLFLKRYHKEWITSFESFGLFHLDSLRPLGVSDFCWPDPPDLAGVNWFINGVKFEKSCSWIEKMFFLKYCSIKKLANYKRFKLSTSTTFDDTIKILPLRAWELVIHYTVQNEI